MDVVANGHRAEAADRVRATAPPVSTLIAFEIRETATGAQ
jgi:hypothetical protein